MRFPIMGDPFWEADCWGPRFMENPRLLCQQLLMTAFFLCRPKLWAEMVRQELQQGIEWLHMGVSQNRGTLL